MSDPTDMESLIELLKENSQKQGAATIKSGNYRFVYFSKWLIESLIEKMNDSGNDYSVVVIADSQEDIDAIESEQKQEMN